MVKKQPAADEGGCVDKKNVNLNNIYLKQLKKIIIIRKSLLGHQQGGIR